MKTMRIGSLKALGPYQLLGALDQWRWLDREGGGGHPQFHAVVLSTFLAAPTFSAETFACMKSRR